MRRKIVADSLLSAALSALLLISYVAISYVAVIAVGTLVIGDIPDPTFSPPWWLNLVAFALIALTFVNVSSWLHDHVNELVYTKDTNSYVLITEVNELLQRMTTPQFTLPHLGERIATVLKLSYLAIEITHVDPAIRYTYGSPPVQVKCSQLAIAYLDRPMGMLQAAPRAVNQPLLESDMALLRDVALHIGTALYAAHLTANLQAARERLVMTREEERRRIRNDLHDGLAPILSSLQLQLGVLAKLVHQNPDQAAAIANDMCEDLINATADIRQLVYALRPPMLDELGLVGAIKNIRLQGSITSFDVIAPEPMPKLPAAVEVAVYRIATEAIHNIVKHAQAKVCTVRIEVLSAHLILTVTDNGTSLPEQHAPGVGLQSMQERAAELGGILSIESGEQSGTRVIARLPMEG